MEEKLKPCPFCGSNATITKLTIPFLNDLKRTRIFAKCANSDCDILPETDSYDTEEEAIEAWNRRPNSWHTGTPTEDGTYLVTIDGNTYDIMTWYCDDGCFYSYGDAVSKNWIKAWQKIEPYEETSK